MPTQPRILVIGATGHVGRKVVAQLHDAGVPVRAMVRNPETARLAPSVEVVRGDLTVPDSLDAALEGVDTAFLVWTAPAAALDSAFDRIAARIRRIVYLSAPFTVPHPFFQNPNAATVLHKRVEARIEAAGMKWTFVRPGMFAGNAIGWWAGQIRSGDIVRWPYLEAPTAPIDARDIAAVAISALQDKARAGQNYVITGPESLTQREQIESIARAIGRTLKIEEMTDEEARSELVPPFPLPVINMLLDAWRSALGRPAYVTTTVAEVTGSPARSYQQWATDHAGAFRVGIRLPGSSGLEVRDRVVDLPL